jgi:hypothetical protein
MPEGHLNPPVFEISKFSQDVSLTKTPYFYNDNGNPVYLAELPEGVTPLVPAPTDPLLAIGREYVVSEVIGIKQTGGAAVSGRI